MTETEFIHLLRRYFPTPFRLLILSTALLQKMRARVTRDGTKCAKNSTFGYDIYFDEVNPIPGKGIQLRSTTPIYIYTWLLVEYKKVILYNFAA